MTYGRPLVFFCSRMLMCANSTHAQLTRQACGKQCWQGGTSKAPNIHVRQFASRKPLLRALDGITVPKQLQEPTARTRQSIRVVARPRRSIGLAQSSRGSSIRSAIWSVMHAEAVGFVEGSCLNNLRRKNDHYSTPSRAARTNPHEAPTNFLERKNSPQFSSFALGTLLFSGVELPRYRPPSAGHLAF